MATKKKPKAVVKKSSVLLGSGKIKTPMREFKSNQNAAPRVRPKVKLAKYVTEIKPKIKVKKKATPAVKVVAPKTGKKSGSIVVKRESVSVTKKPVKKVPEPEVPVDVFDMDDKTMSKVDRMGYALFRCADEAGLSIRETAKHADELKRYPYFTMSGVRMHLDPQACTPEVMGSALGFLTKADMQLQSQIKFLNGR